LEASVRSRAILLTFALLSIIALTAIVPKTWRNVQALRAENTGYSPPYSPYAYYLAFLPILTGGGGEVCIPIQGVEITGETEGVPDTYVFETTITPTNATEPISYQWDNGDTTASSSRALSAGQYLIEVTVNNCGENAAQDDHQILIEDPYPYMLNTD
jgi:hypothetical protein